MNYTILNAEITNDPLTRSYSGMTNAEVATSLNTINRTSQKTSMTGSEVINNVNATEWGALDATQKQTVWDIVHLGNINPYGVEATLLTGVFGAGSTTITALAAARLNSISRATELGLEAVTEGHVERVRSIE